MGGAIAYHLAVVLDDAAENITHVVRGADLFAFTPVQVILQSVLNLPTPVYIHHRLLRDQNGVRLAKRCDSESIAAYRLAGLTADALIARLDFEKITC